MDITKPAYPTEQPTRRRALLVSHRGERCGVWQFGHRLHEVLSFGYAFDWDYAECCNFSELESLVRDRAPTVILLNFHPLTLGWAADTRMRDLGAALFAVLHESDQSTVPHVTPDVADFWLSPDPTLVSNNPAVLATTRFMPDPCPVVPEPPDLFTVGSFGFATPGKGFDNICRLVDNQFERARIRINIPWHDSDAIVPRAHVEACVAACHRAITKPGIELVISHDFLDAAALVRFLAENTINVFAYEETIGRGVSSCTDYALASGRPVGVSRSSMFRNLLELNPSVCIFDVPLAVIAGRGSAQLEPLRAAYSKASAAATWNGVIADALERVAVSISVPDGRGFNKILDDRSRKAYGDALRMLAENAPEVLSRKIERANIQQAFALDTTLRFASSLAAPKILALGSYEDTCVATLRAMGYNITEIDPSIDRIDLADFYFHPGTISADYDIVLCVSVLEHVADDRRFVRMAADLLAPGGVAIFTVDFADAWVDGAPKPAVDHRLYTSSALRQLGGEVLPDCILVDTPRWNEGREDFEYEGCRYGFASWVFRKFDGETLRRATRVLASDRHDLLRARLHHLKSELAATSEQFGAMCIQIMYSWRFDGAPTGLRLALRIARLLRKMSWLFRATEKSKFKQAESRAWADLRQRARNSGDVHFN